LSQNSALVPKKCAKRSAVSPVMAPLAVQNLRHAIGASYVLERRHQIRLVRRATT